MRSIVLVGGVEPKADPPNPIAATGRMADLYGCVDTECRIDNN